MITIRLSTNKDIAFIAKLTRDNMSELIDWNDQMFRKSIKTKNISIILLNNNRVGLLDCEKIKEKLYIHNIQVKKRFRRRGIGKFAIKNALFIAKKLGSNCLFLKLSKNNLDALNFYKKMGFNFSSNSKDNNMFLKKSLIFFEKCH